MRPAECIEDFVESALCHLDFDLLGLDPLPTGSR